MPIEIKIDDADLLGFSGPAKAGIQKAGAEFVTSVIAEANRLESGQNNSGGPVEITQAMIADAVTIQRRSLGSRKKPSSDRILSVASGISWAVSGFLYDSSKLQDATYMAVFIGVVALAIILTTISAFRE